MLRCAKLKRERSRRSARAVRELIVSAFSSSHQVVRCLQNRCDRNVLVHKALPTTNLLCAHFSPVEILRSTGHRHKSSLPKQSVIERKAWSEESSPPASALAQQGKTLRTKEADTTTFIVLKPFSSLFLTGVRTYMKIHSLEPKLPW